MPKELTSIRERIYWGYANLAMAHAAVTKGASKYSRVHYMIRAKLYKGLLENHMAIGSLMDDEKEKHKNKRECVYCRNTSNLTLDHLIPKYSGGSESGDNAVWACKSCNSSKNKKDVLLWFKEKEEFPPLMVLRRYLKLALLHFDGSGQLDSNIENSESRMFMISLIPREALINSGFGCQQAGNSLFSLSPPWRLSN